MFPHQPVLSVLLLSLKSILFIHPEYYISCVSRNMIFVFLFSSKQVWFRNQKVNILNKLFFFPPQYILNKNLLSGINWPRICEVKFKKLIHFPYWSISKLHFLHYFYKTNDLNWNKATTFPSVIGVNQH